MILLDPDDQQHRKLNSDVAGTTVRLPLPVAGRSSLLPDYETSQAQHNSPSSPAPSSSTLSFRKHSLQTVDSRFWRATLYALAIYIALCVTIGVPLIVTKLARQHKNGPAPWENGSASDASLSSPLVMINSGLFSMSQSILCNKWNSTTISNDGLYHSKSTFSLDPEGSFSIRSSAWNTDAHNSQTQVSGRLTVDINPDHSATTAIFHLTAMSTSLGIRDACKICFSPSASDGDSRGLSLYIPTNLTAHQTLAFNITLLFPQSSSPRQLDNLVTYLPMFTQTIGSISPRVILENLVLEGMHQGIRVDSVWANQISVKNLVGPISGSYNATNLLKLDTVQGSISAHLTVVQGPTRDGPTFFSLDTGESEINADVVLLAPTPATSSSYINFVGHVKNFDGPITLNITHDKSTAPVPLDLMVQNNQAPCNVSLDSKFSGTYDISTKLAIASAFMKSTPNHTSSGTRCMLPELDAPSAKYGWIGWGEKPASYNPRQQGQVVVVSSLSPVSLSVGL
ncbi:hypothetical protein BDP27DRAFT_1324358 [Rhodocollybia butyracea]|uniref:Uncharacterized protein n=1 Tax=Rhodocollybia butyracea TaxID=206335 RepID=A0A9P5PVG2_9AGAR|nr:hypothetical protein BDP27DRAFT_1324358 [Rhodocollybia butyracea]